MLEEKLLNFFNLPIEYCNEIYKTPNNLYDDLELLETKDGKENAVYDHLFKPQSIFSSLMMHKWASQYTTNVDFLRDTQKVMKKNLDISIDKKDIVSNAWLSFKEIKEDPNFIDKYQFIGWDYLKFLNNSIIFLTMLSAYSILSPLLNLMAPLLLLIVPFIIMKFKKIPITLTNYFGFIVNSFRRHSFGKLLTDWDNLRVGQRLYMLAMFGMYIYNIYQNCLSCYQFYQNTNTINTNITNLKTYLIYTQKQITNHVNKIDKLKTYSPFKNYLLEKRLQVNKIYNELENIPLASFNPKKIPYIGYTMQKYYKLFDDQDIEETMLFTFGFHGYLDNIRGISSSIFNNTINKAKFYKRRKAMLKITDSYYPILQCQDKKSSIVRNSFDMEQNKIITGPNASGKTSILKSTITNLLISQQIGYGYYKRAKITPFHKLHCYLNIPDTSGRDSLFQAEARRCLDILNTIKNNDKLRHFCIFDELFSGTNPYEAISSASAYLADIITFKNVKFLLTTHFIRLCKHLDNNKQIENVHMKTTFNNLTPQYYYKLQTGISNIKGGVTVLKDLGYPDKIIKDSITNLQKL